MDFQMLCLTHRNQYPTSPACCDLPKSIGYCNHKSRLGVRSWHIGVSLHHYTLVSHDWNDVGEERVYHLTFRALHGLLMHKSDSQG
jgi:hypothetical protein